MPALFKTLFPSWFAGFAFAAIAIGALVPAAVMSIGAANLFTRNFWKAYVDPNVTPAGEAKVAKIVSLVVKVGALLRILLHADAVRARPAAARAASGSCRRFPALVFGLYLELVLEHRRCWPAGPSALQADRGWPGRTG